MPLVYIFSRYPIAASRVSRDVNSYTKTKNTIEPTAVFKGHTSVVGVSAQKWLTVASLTVFQDVDWHPMKENVFASVGDDKMLMLFVSNLKLGTGDTERMVIL